MGLEIGVNGCEDGGKCFEKIITTTIPVVITTEIYKENEKIQMEKATIVKYFEFTSIDYL